MRLFGQPSDRLIESYREILRVESLDHPLPLDSGQIVFLCFRPERLQINIRPAELDSITFRIGAQSQRQDISINCLRNAVNLAMKSGLSRESDPIIYGCEANQVRLLFDEDARRKTVSPISTADLNIRTIDVTHFGANVKRFSFNPLREEASRSLFDERRRPGITSRRLSPVRPPDPPPASTKADLPERLRRLLTPPIHEILSDPQLGLPEDPFPYQMKGIKWLFDRETGLLADEMGLGKTMQAIIAARLLWREQYIKHVLIICPKALIPNWRRELQTWWPGIWSYSKIIERDREYALRQSKEEDLVKIINYEALPGELDWLKEKPPFHDLIIIDEAQRIKNPKSKAAQAVKAMKADRRWALTGTPLENCINDLVSIFGFVKPGLVREVDSPDKIKSAIRPYMLRRTQEEVLPDLPEKVEQDLEIELASRQRETYDRAERDGVVQLNEMGDSITVTHVWTLIGKLRQICNFDPATGESAKAEFLIEELKELLDNQRKALIFGHFVDEPFGLKSLAKILEKRVCKGIRPLELHGEIPARSREGVVDRFQNDPNHPLLLLNYKVGGVGLNLQAANYVFLFDRWWNPAVEDQAIKRCHRLGQKQTVFAMRFYCKDTVEDRILAKLVEKRRLFSQIVDEGRPEAHSGLSEEEVFSLFQDLRVRPRNSNRSTAAPTRLVLDNIDHRDFENLVAMIYEKEGYQVEVTGRSHDGGVDILAQRSHASGNDRMVIQCKHQKQNVGGPVVRELWGVLNSDARLTQCALVTSSGFTPQAQEFAAGKRVVLIDRAALVKLVEKHGIAQIVSQPSDSKPADKASATDASPAKQTTQCSNAGSGGTPIKSPLSAWDGRQSLGSVREALKQNGKFEGSWERFLQYLGLPYGIGLTRDTTVAEAILIARRHG